MKRLLTPQCPRGQKGRPARRAPLRAEIETLEERCLMSTTIFIDFDGVTRAELDEVVDTVKSSGDLRKGWGGTIEDVSGIYDAFAFLGSPHPWRPDPDVSFYRPGGYTNFRFLDFDGNGKIDAADADLAARKIVQRVQQKYSPYDVSVVRQDSTAVALDRMTSNTSHDALIFVTGAYGNAGEWGGQAPLDPGNRRDNAGNAGAVRGVAYSVAATFYGGGLPANLRAEAFLNVLANLVSHEAGHTFGLRHIDVDLYAKGTTDPRGRSVMTWANGARNVAFADVYYMTQDGLWQNEHQYLTETLGPSRRRWAAVLRPGELTIQGSQWNDQVTVGVQAASGEWTITGTHRGFTSFVDPDAQPHPWDSPPSDLRSLNQYGVDITSIRFYGGQGDDVLEVDSRVDAVITAYGDAGNDQLQGGAAGDFLYGGTGDDILTGNGGDDTLYGESGRDALYGGDGADRLYGSTGNDVLRGGQGDDYLSGGADNDRLIGQDGDDYLYGGTGLDVLYGQLGDDFLYGGRDADRLYGGGGDDFLRGGTGDDRLYGQAGTDQLRGDEGQDYLDGGFDDRRDTLIGGDAADTFVDHRTLQVLYDPFTRQWTSRLASEDLLSDYDPAEDGRIVLNH